MKIKTRLKKSLHTLPMGRFVPAGASSRKTGLIVTAVAFGFIGVYLQIRSMAAGPVESVQTANSQLSGALAYGADADGTYVQFGRTVSRLEAEVGDHNVQVVQRASASGGEVVGYFGTQGNYVTFRMNAPEEGTYNATLRYAAADGVAQRLDPLPRTILVNGESVKTVNFPRTSQTSHAWDTLTTMSMGTLELNAGINDIMIRIDTALEGHWEVDYLELSRSAPVNHGDIATFNPSVVPVSATDITNPYHGMYQWLGSGPNPSNWPVIDTYRRYTWRQLEPSEGNYDFSVIENDLALAQSRGGRLGFGVMSLSTCCAMQGSYVLMPQYLVNEGIGVMNGGKFYPNYNHSRYLSRWEALKAALGDRFDNDKRLGYVDIRGYGDYGEWHEWSNPVTHPISDASARRLVDASINNFPNTQLLMLSAHIYANEYALLRSPRVGLRIDCLGANEMGGAEWFLNQVVLRGNVDPYERWKVAPLVTEWCGSANFAWGLNQIQQFHVSSLSSGNFRATPDQNYFDSNKISGIRVVLNEVKLPGRIGPGSAFSVESKWSNVNVAPAYDDWNIQFQFRNQSTGAVVYEGTSSLDLRTLLPTGGNPRQVTDSFTMPASVAPGTYRLHVKVVDAGGYMPPFNLAITGKTSDGAYYIGDITVGN